MYWEIFIILQNAPYVGL